MDRDKVQVVLDWPLLTTVTPLRGFLGLIGYYRWFVHNFVIIASPLTDLLKKNAFTWTIKATATFSQLQWALLQALVLQLPNFAKKFNVETDAFGTGIGVVLAQEGHLIAYFNKKTFASHAAVSSIQPWDVCYHPRSEKMASIPLRPTFYH